MSKDLGKAILPGSFFVYLDMRSVNKANAGRGALTAFFLLFAGYVYQELVFLPIESPKGISSQEEFVKGVTARLLRIKWTSKEHKIVELVKSELLDSTLQGQ